MLDDFFTRAIVAGVGAAAVAAPLGCLVVWRRLAYFGDTLSHAALLGVAMSLLLQINVTVGVFVSASVIAVAMFFLQKRNALSSDALLGLLAHSSLAIGLVALAFMTWIRVDLLGLLFGDILAVSRTDILVIYAGGAIVLGVLAWIWHPLFAATVNREIAEAEGQSPDWVEIVFLLLMALVIAIALKIIGVLLITALLIIPAAAARRLATGPEQMAIIAAAVGALSVIAGLYGSLHFDTPSGPSIVVAAMVLFSVALTPVARLFVRRPPKLREH